jgi:hypothetical protein
VPVVKRAWAALVGAVPVDEVAVAGEAAAITIENTVSQEPGIAGLCSFAGADQRALLQIATAWSRCFYFLTTDTVSDHS